MRIMDSERGIPTANLKRCVGFYTQVLGFTKVSESRDRCTVALGSDEVVFRRGHKKEVQSLREIGFSLSFRISGIREYYDRVRATGRAEVTFELAFMQPGVWQFVLVDCNGYPICDVSAGASNERPGVDPGWRVLFAFGSPWPRVAQAGPLI